LLSLTVALALSSGTALAEGISAEGKDFIKDAAQGGIAEVKLGGLAMKNASDQKVKDFGGRMIREHMKANAQLVALAAKERVALPADVGDEHEKTYDELARLSGLQFDKAYVDAMVEDHEKDVAEFEKIAKQAKDDEVGKFASQTLPTLRQHLEQARSLQSSFR
jgi:putative membrane protein